MIVITAATGKLGHHIVDALLEKVSAADIAVAVRNTEKAADFAARGVQVRFADYEKPESLKTAFAGAEKLLLISSSELGKRERQHKAAIAAAVEAGVGFVAYTSILRADRSTLGLAPEHLATEEAIQASGIPHAFLRNGWYLENYTENLGQALEHGVMMGAAIDGKIAAASRRDYAEAAVAVLLADQPENIYELAGDESFTMSDLAGTVAAAAKKPVSYKDMPAAEYRQALLGFGLPAPFAELLADSDVGISQGQLDDDSGVLGRLIGRSTTPLRDAVAAALG